MCFTSTQNKVTDRKRKGEVKEGGLRQISHKFVRNRGEQKFFMYVKITGGPWK